MIYVLVKDGEVVATRGFTPDDAPDGSMAANKGRWLPCEVERAEFDPVREVQTGPTVVVEADRVRYVYETAPRSLDERKAEMLRTLADKRWQVETGGVEVGGVLVPTDRGTQAIVSNTVGAFADGSLTPGSVVKFKIPSGFITLTEDAMKAIKKAGAQHVQASFAREEELDAAINGANDHDALDAIDLNAGW